MRYCDFSGCHRKHYGYGWCRKHYQRWKRNGDPSVLLRDYTPITLQHLLAHSKINNDTGCIEWQRAKDGDYGTLNFRGKKQNVHRIAWLLGVGEIKKGLLVCHECDNPPCINLDHLFLGTHKDNMLDAKMKGRMTRGEDSSQSKLTEKDVIAIREMTDTNASIGKMFGVAGSTISCIRHRKNWAWLK